MLIATCPADGSRITYEGRDYVVGHMGRNVHTGAAVLCLTLIGRKGRPVKRYRAATWNGGRLSAGALR